MPVPLVLMARMVLTAQAVQTPVVATARALQDGLEISLIWIRMSLRHVDPFVKERCSRWI